MSPRLVAPRTLRRLDGVLEGDNLPTDKSQQPTVDVAVLQQRA